MPFVPQAVAASSTINHQKSRENEVRLRNNSQYLCNKCTNFVLTKENFKKHYNEVHPNYHYPKKIQEDEFYNCTIL